MWKKIFLSNFCGVFRLSLLFLLPSDMRSNRDIASDLVLLSEVLLLALSLGGLGSDLLVILLEGGKILTGLGELSLLHTLSDIPVDEGTLGVHKIELVVNAGQGLSDGGGVGNHADGTLDAGKISSGDDGGGLVVDAALESSGAPVDELDGPLGLDGGNGGVDILGDDISTVHEAAGHVLSVAGVALGHHTGGLEDTVGDLTHGQLLVVGLLGRDDGSITGKHEVDTGVGHQVGLELSDIDVQGTIETETGSQRGDDLGNQPVKVGVGGPLNVKVATADVVQGLVIHAEGAVGVLEETVGGEHTVVGLNDGGRHLGGRRDGETQLGLASVVDRKPLKKETSKTRSGSSSGGVEDKESLKAGAVIGELPDAVKDKVNNLLSDGVVSTGVVVGGILLSGDDLLRVVELPVGSRADLVTDGGLQVNVDGTGDVLSSSSLGEEGVESVITSTDGLVGRHLAVRLDTVLEAVKLPAAVTGLDTGLAHVDTDAFCGRWGGEGGGESEF